MKADNPSKEGNFKEADTILSTEWALLYLTRRKNMMTFELTNRKSNRTHKLIFSNAGTDDIIKESGSTCGVYPNNFKTNYPASFENFDDTLTVLTPGGKGQKYIHILRIGWLATVVISQPHGEGYGTWYLYGNCRIEYGSGEGKYGRVSPTSAGGGMGKVSMSDSMF